MAITRGQVPDILANMAALGQTAIKVDAKGTLVPIDPAKEVEYATDKEAVKIVGCRAANCARPVVVTTFMAPAKVECRVCQGEAGPNNSVASVGVPVPGETDPAKAVDLAKCLLNKEFESVACPMCSEAMELKSVNHNDNYGPGHWTPGGKNGPTWIQDAKGETVMHQCNRCLTVITITNTARHAFKRINEPRPGKNSNIWADITGVRSPETKENAA